MIKKIFRRKIFAWLVILTFVMSSISPITSVEAADSQRDFTTGVSSSNVGSLAVWSQPAYAFDGRTDTVYVSEITADVNKNVWFNAKLDSLHSINCVKLYPYNASDGSGIKGFPQDFTIQVSETGTNGWTTVATYTGYQIKGTDAQVFEFPSVTASYVRINATKLGTCDGSFALAFSEMEVLNTLGNESGVNQLTGVSVSVSSNQASVEWAKSEHLADVDLSTKYLSSWDGEMTRSEWIKFSFGETKTIGHVELFAWLEDSGDAQTVKGFPENFDIRVSDDGEIWTTVASFTGVTASASSPRKWISFPTVEAKHIGLFVTKLGGFDTKAALALGGMHVYDAPAATPIITKSDVTANWFSLNSELYANVTEPNDFHAYAMSDSNLLKTTVLDSSVRVNTPNTVSLETIELHLEAIREKTDLSKNIGKYNGWYQDAHIGSEQYHYKNLFDGTTDTYYRAVNVANPNTNYYVDVELTSLCYANRVNLYPHVIGNNTVGFPKDFTIQVSETEEDGSWITVAVYTDYVPVGTEVQTFDFPSIKAKYVRIDVTELGAIGTGVYSLDLSEIEVLNTCSKYDISAYRTAEGEYTHPTQTDMVFGGWYNDMSYKTPIEEDAYQGTAYAKWVDEKVLGVKAQLPGGTPIDENGRTIMRIVTTVDCADYAEVGFDVSTKNHSMTYTDTRFFSSIQSRYDSIKVDYTPSEEFHKTSQLFSTIILKNLKATGEHLTKEFTIKPFWITADGTKAYGITRVLTIYEGVTGSASIQYYVDAKNGNDQNDGVSEATAFKSLERVNQLTLKPGDQLLFKKDCIWNGSLQPTGSGSAENPIIIGTYGEGTSKPVINGMGAVDATIHLVNISHVEICNLEVTNYSESADAYRSGILLEARDQNVQDIVVSNCYVHDVTAIDYALEEETVDEHWFGGIQVKSIQTNQACRIDDVVIENNRVENVGRTGIAVCGWSGGVKCRNVTVRGNVISNIDGDGIILAGVDTGIIEKNVVSKCSQAYDAVNDGRVSVSMFVITCNDITIQYNEAYLNNYNGDAQGYDIDGDCQNVILQYNYSHDNAGGFLLLVQSTQNGKVIVRYNISENDAGILYRMAYSPNAPQDQVTGSLMDAHIYNNSVYTTKPLQHVIKIWGFPIKNTTIATFENNIFYILNNSDGTMPQYRISSGVTVFDHNAFYGDKISSEPNDANKVTGNPLFVGPGTGGNGRDTLGGYKLQAGSPCLGSGKLITDNGGYDYWGNAVSQTAAPNIGAYNGSAVNVP